jgi:ribosomal protection tetracycline resistance protein
VIWKEKMISNRLTIGILAHVDAGKTTLSEGLMYLSGSLRKFGRVDHKDAFLDTFEIERARGITIFSKQAIFPLGDKMITLVDTPGHVDFSSEMERTLQILDYGILVINGADGIQGHTLTLWKLFRSYNIPVFIFVNKMDQEGTCKESLISELESRLDEHCVEFSEKKEREDFYDALAMCDEYLMESFLQNGTIEVALIKNAIKARNVFPVFFGSALKLEGVAELLEGLDTYSDPSYYREEFAAKVYKIARDAQGNRLTYMKITGGKLKVKDLLEQDKPIAWKEKVDQIRLYSGIQFQTEKEVPAGTLCAVTGLTKTYSGEGLGKEKSSQKPMLKPVLNYKVQMPHQVDLHEMLTNLRQLEEEEPQLNSVWNEQLNEIHVQVMGDIQIEILKNIILERFNIAVEFGTGSLVYKETICDTVEGVGHFEPLRHYAEVHLLLEPGQVSSGLVFSSKCSEDVLDRNWQRLIVSHLEEKRHIGVLTGSEITDMKITLVAGRGHLKHTEGGDFRQATYRAVRQGLKKAKSILLEPIYEYRLEVPKEVMGRAISDIQRMKGNFQDPRIEKEIAIIIGSAPVLTMRDYHKEVIAYTRGTGRLSVSLKGYEPCHNTEEIIRSIDYDPEADLNNPTSSIFCSQGTGFTVNWDQVESYMHIESYLKEKNEADNFIEAKQQYIKPKSNAFNQTDKELEAIFLNTYGPSKRDTQLVYNRQFLPKKERIEQEYVTIKRGIEQEKYLLVDGYNIIFDWADLKALASSNLDAARLQLMDRMCNYQSFRMVTVIIVFDAYRVPGNLREMSNYHNIHIVYTKEAETADQYIERLADTMSKQYDVTVATSDALEQMIIMGKGATRLSAQGLWEEVELVAKEIRDKYVDQETKNINVPFSQLNKNKMRDKP